MQIAKHTLLLTVTLLLSTALGCAEAGDEVVQEPTAPTWNNSGDGGSAGGGAGDPGGGTTQPPDGPPACEDELRRCSHSFSLVAQGGEQSVSVHGDFAPDGWDNGVAMTLTDGVWSAEVDVPWDTAVQYKFVVEGNWIQDPANPEQIDDGNGNTNSLLSGLTCEEWTCVPELVGAFDWRDAVLYFVFVDRFYDGDPGNNTAVGGVESAANYQGGDWAGVLAKIEEGYFTDLGVNVLWLSVPMDNSDDSGMGTDGHMHSAYHGYWPRDLNAPEARFGTMDELVALVDAAHERDIKVIVDYAMNHVHISSPVYAQHKDWFWPLDNNGNYCVCGQGCGWGGDDGRRCWFTDYLPDFNFTNPAARDFSVSNAIKWIQDTGIDGFRLDAVKHIEDAWITELRARVKSEIEPVSGERFYMVGETYTGDKDTIKYYVNPSTMLDGQFDFPLRAAMISALLTRSAPMTDLAGFLGANDGYYGAGIMSTFIGNHDVPRSIHFAQDNPAWSNPWDDGKNIAWAYQPGLPSESSAFERLANAFTVLYALPGVPLIYYGDEIGLPGAGDPDNRRAMQWSGYSPAQETLKKHLASLATIRAAHPAMRRGARTTLSATTETMAFRMQEGSDVVIVAVNRGDNAASVGGLDAGSYTDALSGAAHSGPTVQVPARSSLVLTTP